MNNQNIALGVLNNVIWTLYQKGWHPAGMLIESERDREALKDMDNKEKARKEREIKYKAVEVIYKQGNRFGSPSEMIAEVAKLGMLEKVFFCLVTNAVKLRSYDKASDLYNASAFSYLYTFEGFREGAEMHKADLYSFRSKLDTVGRCIRFIKADHPFMFNTDLIKASDKADKEAIDTFGNSTV